MLKILDTLRKEKALHSDLRRKSELGQFMTPSSVAEFMASLFQPARSGTSELLDAGAGLGALSTAFLLQFNKWNLEKAKLRITAFEVDDFLRLELENLFACLAFDNSFDSSVRPFDFIEDASHQILFERPDLFDYVILNPPYKKISSASQHRSRLRSVGIETVNLYSAFVALAIKLLKEGGQLVAILPRSFCNGPYYKSFREQIFRETAVRHIHLFDSRNKAFKEDGVLQENVVIALEKGGVQGDVIISTSTDDTFSDLQRFQFPFSRIVYEGDTENFLHIPTSTEPDFHEGSLTFNQRLSDLFIEVSTGPVVDFRVREHTSDLLMTDSVPLLYPGHFEGSKLVWPRENWKKPNAIAVNEETKRWLYPTGFYTVVRRFSSKEEKRRIRAHVFEPHRIPEAHFIGFENHFNVFHFRKEGIEEDIAFGIAAFLNSTSVDKYFRRMNGHTQVNATDLRQLRYPSLDILSEIGKLSRGTDVTDQKSVDVILRTVLDKCIEM